MDKCWPEQFELRYAQNLNMTFSEFKDVAESCYMYAVVPDFYEKSILCDKVKNEYILHFKFLPRKFGVGT